MKIKCDDKYFVYIVKCSKGTFYAGSTNNLKKRIELHNAGKGAKYLRGKAPVMLVYAKEIKGRGNALKEEMRIKRLRRKQKEELVEVYREG